MLKYIFLGIVQGVTEFLPVSSSGHLVILQKALGVAGQELAVSVVLHIGTLCALILFFFKDILDLLRNVKWLILIAVVTVVTGIIGILGRDFFEGLFSSPKAVAVALMVTGVILIRARLFINSRRNILDIVDALVLGLVQGAAIIPGLSRSGITISSLLFRKIDKELAFRFSFLAAIPAILGALVLEAKKVGFALTGNSAGLLAGFIASFIAGIISLWLLRLVLRKAKLHYFGIYCIIAALITLLFIK
ncbi:MAG: undecaprenyl-diphosphate phosphatase [Candidatus Omnitrophica bacterium]|nr:undecaprenyl-diphosphate phosphatase [Candidatus Omnitrophota bacterium]MBL7210457.1 undecaprenyl-diphosphate phosphatase [Candidatus Omnitrophota bacterium]